MNTTVFLKTANLAISKRSLIEVVGALTIYAGGYVHHWFKTRNDVPKAVKEAEAKAAKKYGDDLKKMDDLRKKDIELFKQILDALLNKSK
jgi:hypothetical protein